MSEATPRIVETYVTAQGEDVFQEWLDEIDDRRAQALVDRTIAKIRLGNLGRHKSVGDGVEEIVLDYGPGYRIYFGEHGTKLIILLLGSTKKRQDEAIKLAKRYWSDWKGRASR